MTPTTTQRKADLINSAYPLASATDLSDEDPSVLDIGGEEECFEGRSRPVVSGSEKREYFTRSPWATITSYERGFVVNNLVTGSQHPVATWNEAAELRSELKNRYVAISNF